MGIYFFKSCIFLENLLNFLNLNFKLYLNTIDLNFFLHSCFLDEGLGLLPILIYSIVSYTMSRQDIPSSFDQKLSFSKFLWFLSPLRLAGPPSILDTLRKSYSFEAPDDLEQNNGLF